MCLEKERNPTETYDICYKIFVEANGKLIGLYQNFDYHEEAPTWLHSEKPGFFAFIDKPICLMKECARLRKEGPKENRAAIAGRSLVLRKVQVKNVIKEGLFDIQDNFHSLGKVRALRCYDIKLLEEIERA